MICSETSVYSVYNDEDLDMAIKTAFNDSHSPVKIFTENGTFIVTAIQQFKDMEEKICQK
jgi:hypothetical protein